MVAYPVSLVRDTNDTFMVESRDLEELATYGKDKADAIRRAKDAIIAAIATRIDHGRDIPLPSAPKGREVLVTLPTLLAGKMLVYLTMKARGVTQARLAKDLKIDARQVRRLLDPTISTHFDEIDRALAALGTKLRVEVESRDRVAV